ncbi:hypothetical protein ACFPN0_31875 [Kitasatospora cinereorecta]
MWATRVALEAASQLHAAGFPVLWHTAPDSGSADFLPADDAPSTALTAECADFLHGGGQTDGLPARLANLAGGSGILLVLDGVDTGLLDGHRLNRLLRDVPGARLLLTAEEPWNVPANASPALPAGRTRPSRRADSPATRFFLSRCGASARTSRRTNGR